MKALYLNLCIDKLLRQICVAIWEGNKMRRILEFFMYWNSRLQRALIHEFLFLFYVVLRENNLTWEILSLHFCPCTRCWYLARPWFCRRTQFSKADCWQFQFPVADANLLYFFPLGNFLFPSVRSVQGLSSWEMHVADSEAKCTKRKQSRCKLRHRHLAYRFDVSVTSFAGQCSCPQSEVFVQRWNSANVTGICCVLWESSHLHQCVIWKK